MGQVATIGLDIAKSVFQVHGVDAEGGVVIRQKLTRARLLKFFEKLSPCLVGIEACGTAHHWARELIGLGHDVRLMPPSYVKPYVKRQKNDMADAEAICEAVTRPTMRFVPVKSPEQQSVMVLHRTRSILIRQRIQISNAIRSHMAEFGMAAAVGRQGLHSLIEVVHDPADERVPGEGVSDQRPIDGGRTPADGDPRREPAADQRSGRHDRRSKGFQDRSQSRGLDRPRS